MNDSDLDSPIFLIGMPRSGTSYIGEVITLHDHLGFISNYVHRFPGLPCLSLLNQITFLPGSGWFLRGRKRQFKGATNYIRWLLPYTGDGYRIWHRLCGEPFLRHYLPYQKADPSVIKQTRQYMKTVLKWQGQSRLFVKLNGPPRIVFLRSIFPKAFFIHVLRDPRSVTASLLRSPWWIKGRGLDKPWWESLPEPALKQWEASGFSSVTLAALQWRQVVELTWQEKEKVSPKKFMEIRYEDFIKNPHSILDDIFSKTGLPDAPNARKYIDTSARPVDMNYKFKQQLSAKDISMIEAVTRDSAARAGYRFT